MIHADFFPLYGERPYLVAEGNQDTESTAIHNLRPGTEAAHLVGEALDLFQEKSDRELSAHHHLTHQEALDARDEALRNSRLRAFLNMRSDSKVVEPIRGTDAELVLGALRAAPDELVAKTYQAESQPLRPDVRNLHDAEEYNRKLAELKIAKTDNLQRLRATTRKMLGLIAYLGLQEDASIKPDTIQE